MLGFSALALIAHWLTFDNFRSSFADLCFTTYFINKICCEHRTRSLKSHDDSIMMGNTTSATELDWTQLTIHLWALLDGPLHLRKTKARLCLHHNGAVNKMVLLTKCQHVNISTSLTFSHNVHSYIVYSYCLIFDI